MRRDSFIITRFLLLFIVLGPFTTALSQEPQRDEIRQALTMGAYYAKGDYGEPTDTEILYFPFSYELDYGKWGFQLLMPYLEVTGVGNVLVNLGGVTRAVAGTQVMESNGIGDTVASLIYRFDPVSDRLPFVDFRLDVKIPTADETRSLGTGETDYSMQLDFSQVFGKTVAFASVGYSFRGKSELFAGLQDSAFAQLGFAQPVSESVSLGMFYDFREKASTFSEESHELVPYFTWQLAENWSFTGLASWGFTNASADTTLLGQLRYTW